LGLFLLHEVCFFEEGISLSLGSGGGVELLGFGLFLYDLLDLLLGPLALMFGSLHQFRKVALYGIRIQIGTSYLLGLLGLLKLFTLHQVGVAHLLAELLLLFNPALDDFCHFSSLFAPRFALELSHQGAQHLIRNAKLLQPGKVLKVSEDSLLDHQLVVNGQLCLLQLGQSLFNHICDLLLKLFLAVYTVHHLIVHGQIL